MKTRLLQLLPLLGIFVFRSVLADQYVIPSGSMEPTIQIGDHVLVSKAAYDLRVPFTRVALLPLEEPRRGDVVVFHDPREPGRHLIKRLMGLPGDRLRVVDGRVAVNGKWLDESSGAYRVQRLPERFRPENREYRVPEGHYFFMGDNRDNSSDSREWGFVARDALEGRAQRVLYSVRWDGWVPEVSFGRAGVRL
jgi:signal peptidase I